MDSFWWQIAMTSVALWESYFIGMTSYHPVFKSAGSDEDEGNSTSRDGSVE